MPDWKAAKVTEALRSVTGNTAAFIAFNQASSADAFKASTGQGSAEATGASRTAATAAARTANSVFSALKARDSHAVRLFATHNAVAGIGVRGNADAIRKLASRTDVRGVYVLSPKTVDNAHAAQLTRVLQTWQDLGVFGDAMRVGVIDTGVDYTHANFGGPGTPAAFDAVDPTDADGDFPTAKVIGGTDLAGEDYDALSGDPSEYTPNPDDNPLDCDGHGSHTSGTVAGFGVNGDGSTFTGDYSALDSDSLNNMRIGPGMAPKAVLYHVKVFGCPGGGAGSTNLVAPAIDWMMDPNGDNDLSDHVDVISISIGGDYGSPDDPESLFVRSAFENGALLSISAGNAGDLYDVGGSPGNTTEALTVASSRDSYELLDAITVNSPAPQSGDKPGQNSVLYDYSDATGVTANVKSLTGTADDPDNLDGCDPIATDLSGEIAWLYWDDNDATRRCGSVARSTNAELAGAVGVLLTSQHNHFLAGISGSPNIPVFQMTKAVTDTLQPTADVGTLNVTMGDASQVHAFDYVDPTIEDTISGFTSRSTRYPTIKPDIAAPGDTIVSTGMGTGNQSLVESGTSMAAPHVAGIATLLREQHPTWSTAEIKAALMNTADHDLWEESNGDGPIEAPNRIGTGRIDARAALGNLVVAADTLAPAAVSVHFITQPLAAPTMVLARSITLTNKGATPVSYNLSYESATDTPGADFTLLQSTVTVPGNGTAKVTVRLSLDRDAMRKTIDPTMEKLQSFFGVADLPRQYLSQESGRVIFTPTAGSSYPLRVTVYADPEPAADITVPGKVVVDGPDGSGFMELGGRGLAQGTLGDDGYYSLYNVSELGQTSAKLKSCAVHPAPCAINRTARGGDLKYVGAGTDSPRWAAEAPGDATSNAVMWFTVATWNGWYNIGHNTVPFVDIDVDRDGTYDFETFVWRQDDTDLLWAYTQDLNTFENVDLEPINFAFGDIDTNTFNSNVVTMPVYLETLGIDAGTETSHRIRYRTGVAGYYTAPGEPLIDFTGRASYDPLAPGLWAEGADAGGMFIAQPGTGMIVHRDASSLMKDPYKKLLVVNLHNQFPNRDALVKVKVQAL